MSESTVKIEVCESRQEGATVDIVPESVILGSDSVGEQSTKHYISPYFFDDMSSHVISMNTGGEPLSEINNIALSHNGHDFSATLNCEDTDVFNSVMYDVDVSQPSQQGSVSTLDGVSFYLGSDIFHGVGQTHSNENISDVDSDIKELIDSTNISYETVASNFYDSEPKSNPDVKLITSSSYPRTYQKGSVSIGQNDSESNFSVNESQVPCHVHNQDENTTLNSKGAVSSEPEFKRPPSVSIAPSGIFKNNPRPRKFCPQCKSNNGIDVELRYFQASLDSSILLCPTKKCTYPFDTPNEKLTIKSNAMEDMLSDIEFDINDISIDTQGLHDKLYKLQRDIIQPFFTSLNLLKMNYAKLEAGEYKVSSDSHGQCNETLTNLINDAFPTKQEVMKTESEEREVENQSVEVKQDTEEVDRYIEEQEREVQRLMLEYFI